MPFVRVNYNEEKYNKNALTLISKNILNSLIEDFNIPPKDYFQVFHSHKEEEIFYDSDYLINGTRSDGILYIQITCGSGRTKEQKKSLYKNITDKLFINCKIPKENVFIMLIETELEDWSFGEGLAQMIK
ncbi:tautomerase family protein [Clostridium sp. 19966]|uniref:tautomerase family protein n=1 Tax=Clostridium sp. 19966 TaxID=2768166 RepID=UPI0028DF7DBB|nr:tautomerase family protein [Clostridium sp. 19966]MDT8715421.1 tautomerase family protein [Clostridium sp. 19966]